MEWLLSYVFWSVVFPFTQRLRVTSKIFKVESNMRKPFPKQLIPCDKTLRNFAKIYFWLFLTKLNIWPYHPSITFQNLFLKEIVFRKPIWNKRQKIIFQTLWQLKTYLFSKAFKRSELIFKCIHVWFKKNFGKDEC